MDAGRDIVLFFLPFSAGTDINFHNAYNKIKVANRNAVSDRRVFAMSKKTNPALIGGFVIGAVILLAVGLLVFGGGKIFQDKLVCVMYFDESISGLDIGAPVEFQGVRVGTVTDVRIEFSDGSNGAVYRPVTIQVEEKRISFADKENTRLSEREYMDTLVRKNGLRAQLASQSMLTGKLKIELGYYPDEPVNRKNRDAGIWEMPTIPSKLQRVTHEIQQLPLNQIMGDVHRAIKSVADIAASGELQTTVTRLNRMLERMDATLERINTQIEPLSGEFIDTTKTARTSLENLNSMIEKIDNNIEPVLENLADSLEKTGRIMDERSPLRHNLGMLIDDFRDLSKSIKRLSDYLEQHPESILRGKK